MLLSEEHFARSLILRRTLRRVAGGTLTFVTCMLASWCLNFSRGTRRRIHRRLTTITATQAIIIYHNLARLLCAHSMTNFVSCLCLIFLQEVLLLRCTIFGTGSRHTRLLHRRCSIQRTQTTLKALWTSLLPLDLAAGSLQRTGTAIAELGGHRLIAFRSCAGTLIIKHSE